LILCCCALTPSTHTKLVTARNRLRLITHLLGARIVTAE
jgi:hypothetical protein